MPLRWILSPRDSPAVARTVEGTASCVLSLGSACPPHCLICPWHCTWEAGIIVPILQISKLRPCKGKCTAWEAKAEGGFRWFDCRHSALSGASLCPYSSALLSPAPDWHCSSHPCPCFPPQHWLSCSATDLPLVLLHWPSLVVTGCLACECLSHLASLWGFWVSYFLNGGYELVSWRPRPFLRKPFQRHIMLVVCQWPRAHPLWASASGAKIPRIFPNLTLMSL